MNILTKRFNSGVDRMAGIAVRELGEGKLNDAEIVYERLKVIASNLSTLAALVVASRLLGTRALEVVGIFMLAMGFTVAKLLESDRQQQIQKARHYVWGLIGATLPLQLLIRWTSTDASWGLPNLLGAEIGPFAQNMGRTVLIGMFVFGIMFIPVMYARESFQAWRMLESKENTQEKIARSSRWREGRRF